MADKREIDEKVGRLNSIREKIEDIKQSRSRLTGELDTHKKRLEELKKSCKESYDLELIGLPDAIKSLEEQINIDMAKAESLLNIGQTEVYVGEEQ